MHTVVKSLGDLMDGYAAAQRAPFKAHPLHDLVRSIRRGLEEEEPIRSRTSLRVRVSVGMGNWAVVPWVGLLDTRETTTTKDGVYIILLFVADMSGVYLTLNQGITQPMETLGRAKARDALRARVGTIRSRFPELRSLGFDVDARIDLRAGRNLASAYEDSTIAQRLFLRKDLRDEQAVRVGLASLLDVYDRYLFARVPLLAGHE